MLVGEIIGTVVLGISINVVNTLLAASPLNERIYAPEELLSKVRESLEVDDNTRLSDIHIWAIGPKLFAAELAVVTPNPLPPGHYKALIPSVLGIVHITMEAHLCEKKE